MLTDNSSVDLFRQEAIDFSRKDNGFGFMAPTTMSKYKFLGLVFFVMVTGILTYEVFQDVALHRAMGHVALDTGVVIVSSDIEGTIEVLDAVPGQHVLQGQRIATISKTTRSHLNANPAAKSWLSTIRKNIDLHQDLRGLLAEKFRVSKEKIQLSVENNFEKLESVDKQIISIKAELSASNQILSKYRALAEAKSISVIDLLRAESETINIGRNLVNFEETRRAIKSEIKLSKQNLREAELNYNEALNQIDVLISNLEQERTNFVLDNSSVVVSPTSGIIGDVLVQEEQKVAKSTPILSLLPEHAKLQAEVFLPASDAGYIVVGQKVTVTIDAYPSEKFGKIEGFVKSRSHTPVLGDHLPILPSDEHMYFKYVIEFLRKEGDLISNNKIYPGMTLTGFYEKNFDDSLDNSY